MAAVLVSPPHTCSLILSPLLLQHPSLVSSRNLVGICSTRKRKCRLREKFKVCCHAYPDFSSHSQVFRRHLLLFGISSSLPFSSSTPSALSAPEDAKMASFTDDINSYSYLYPTTLPTKKIVLKWVESRKPERYSSAAPLSPDARLRIVSERVDIIHNLVISITIGPPNTNFLKTKDKISWNAKDVADSVLSDKSALRVTSAQRMAESSLLNASSSEVDGEPYWYYDYLVRKSPAKNAQQSNLYRHYVSSTAERDGYLYTLNASTLSKQWDVMGPLLETTAASFRLLPPTDNYVPPFKDPWRFW